MSTSVDDMSRLGRALLEAEEATRSAELALKVAKEHERQLREETIPGAMQELGIESLKLATGETLSVKQDVYAQIPAGNKPAAFQWLDDHGYGGLVKQDVVISFGRGEDELARAAAAYAAQQGWTVKSKTDVNAQTFRAFLREQLAAGAELPLDLFGARPVWTAKVK